MYSFFKLKRTMFYLRLLNYIHFIHRSIIIYNPWIFKKIHLTLNSTLEPALQIINSSYLFVASWRLAKKFSSWARAFKTLLVMNTSYSLSISTKTFCPYLVVMFSNLLSYNAVAWSDRATFSLGGILHGRSHLTAKDPSVTKSLQMINIKLRKKE